MSNLYSIFPASFVGGSTLNVTQLHSVRPASKNQKTEVIPGGQLDRQAVITAFAEPEVVIESRDVKTILDATGVIIGLSCTSGATIRLQQRADGSSYQTGTNHLTITSTKGFLAPTRLSAEQDSQDGANLELMYWALYDGTNLPLVVNTGVDFGAAPAPAFNFLYYLGPVYSNAASIDGIVGVSIDFGIGYVVKRLNGEAFARVGTVNVRRPTFNIRTKKASYLATCAMFGYALPGVLACYFQKGVHGASRVAAATTGHIKISCATGDLTPDDVAVTNEDDATVTVTVRPTGSLSVSTGSAIP